MFRECEYVGEVRERLWESVLGLNVFLECVLRNGEVGGDCMRRMGCSIPGVF